MYEFITAFERFKDFSGRSREREFWVYWRTVVIIGLILRFLDSGLGLYIGRENFAVGVLSTIFGLICLLPSLAVSVRRLHDMGRSGRWIFILLIPIVGTLVYFVFVLTDSQPGSNKWGPSPKGVLS